jgi:hypothetical protein
VKAAKKRVRRGSVPRGKALTRLQQHRAEMRRKGFKLVQLWVPDPAAPGFSEAVRQTKKFLEAHPDAEWDAFAGEVLDQAPGWDDS